MKLVIQIPCLNEEAILPVTLAALPREVEGFDAVEWLIVDDGSTDDTVQTALRNGADHAIGLGRNAGLAQAFMTGLTECLRLGADIIVNIDADNQYRADCIGALTAPILAGEADYVVGARPIVEIDEMSAVKKRLQRIGSWTVRICSGIDIPDAPSGFRAISRDAAMRLNVFNRYSYTLETLIQAGQSDIRTISVPIDVNPATRPSRLVRSTADYVRRSAATILRFFILYRAFPFFLLLAAILFGAGALLGLRFVFLNLVFGSEGHVQSVILAGMLMTLGFMTGMTAIVADLIGLNRRLLEQLRREVLTLRFEKPAAGKPGAGGTTDNAHPAD